MGSFAAGAVVVVRFPFSDLSQSKLRPAVVLADAGRGDSVLGQLTSSSYSDPLAIEIAEYDLRGGSLQTTSYARPGKLFTPSRLLISSPIADLNQAALDHLLDAVVGLLQAGRTP